MSKTIGSLTYEESPNSREATITTEAGQTVRVFMHGDVPRIEIDGQYVGELSLDDSND